MFVSMDSGTSIAFQIVLRLVDDRVIAPDSASRRVLAATIARVGRDRGLLAFGAADTHIHVAALCDRINAGLLARSLEMALRTALALPVCFAAPSITRVSDQHHLKATFGYVQRNARRHGIADPDATEGSSLHDLLGMRTTSLWLGDRVRGALPRTTRGDLLDLLAMPGLGVVGPVGADLADATAAVFGLRDCRGRTPEAVSARATGISLVTGIWTPDAIAETFRVSVRTVERLRSWPVVPADREGLRRQLAWRAAARAASGKVGF